MEKSTPHDSSEDEKPQEVKVKGTVTPVLGDGDLPWTCDGRSCGSE